VTTKEIGDFGEHAAEIFLEQKGYSILERQFRCKMGEIDLIAEQGDYTIFVEVKTRKNCNYGRPSEYVDWKKQEKIRKTALFYMGSLSQTVRFDVIEVFYDVQKGECSIKKIEHLENAF
jgi:putative endonuclease